MRRRHTHATAAAEATAPVVGPRRSPGVDTVEDTSTSPVDVDSRIIVGAL